MEGGDAEASGARAERAERMGEPLEGERHEPAEYALLGLLREGSRHGYRLVAEFRPEGRLGIALRLKMSQLYAYLRKLERQGLLASHDEAPAGLRRSRRVFALTPAGERVFDAWLATPVEATREVQVAFLLKLAFTLADPPAALALLTRQRAATSAWLARQRAREVRLLAQADAAPAEMGQAGQTRAMGAPPSLALLALRRRILLSEATLAWLDDTRARLDASRDTAHD